MFYLLKNIVSILNVSYFSFKSNLFLYFSLMFYVYIVFSCLNFRILYFILISNIVLYIILSVVIKHKKSLSLSNKEITIVSEITIFILFKDPISFIIQHSISTFAYQAFMIGVLGCIFVELQSRYGSRFFLPNRCRTK